MTRADFWTAWSTWWESKRPANLPWPSERDWRATLVALNGISPADLTWDDLEWISNVHIEVTNSGCECGYCCAFADLELGGAR